MNTTARRYTIRVDGHLDDHWSAWLGELVMTRHDDGTTTLTVEVADQAQLHGVFAGLRDIGAAIVDVRTTGPPVDAPRLRLPGAARRDPPGSGVTSARLHSSRLGPCLRCPLLPRGSRRSVCSLAWLMAHAALISPMWLNA